ncbi:MAG: hypothetical protein WCJ19_04415 [bacterium]
MIRFNTKHLSHTSECLWHTGHTVNFTTLNDKYSEILDTKDGINYRKAPKDYEALSSVVSGLIELKQLYSPHSYALNLSTMPLREFNKFIVAPNSLLVLPWLTTELQSSLKDI